MKIQLKLFNEVEYNNYQKLFESSNVCQYMDILPFRCEIDFQKFLNSTLENINNNRSKRFSIYCDDEFCGTINLYSIFWHQKRASLGYALKQEFWKKGIMSISLKKIEEISLELGLHRLQATVLKENRASQALLEKQGYSYEGTLKDYEIWEGKGFVDLMMYSKIC